MADKTPVPMLDMADRPRFARTMVAVWRWHHLAKGEDLVVLVWPGEWPEGGPAEVAGARVDTSEDIGGRSAILVLGKARGKWLGAQQLMSSAWRGITAKDLAIACAFMEVGDDRRLKIWLHPDPDTGAPSPVWTRRRSR